MAKLLRGVPVSVAIEDELVDRVAVLEGRGVVPALAIVRVGERDDDLSYERGAEKHCGRVGINVRRFVLPPDCSQDELIDVIAKVNADESVHGCLMFRPLPKTLDEVAACMALEPAKDIDCITAGSLYGVFANRPTGFPPCTAEACIELLDYYGIGLEGVRVVVVGRSLVVGKPVSCMLQARNATVTVCHTRTKNLADELSRAEVIVAAAGHVGTVGPDCVREGQTIVDVGINWDEKEERLIGDVDFDAVEPIVSAITPVPGGVGSVTTAVLCRHVIEAAERKGC